MMKKKEVNIIAILAIVLALIVVGGVILFFTIGSSGGKKAASSGGFGSADLGEAVLKLENIDQFREFAEAKSYECYLGEDLSGGSIMDVSLMERDVVVTYFFDQQGKTTDFQAFYYINGTVEDEFVVLQEMPAEEISTGIADAIDIFCTMFNCGAPEELYLSNADGTFSVVENQNFQSIIDGNAGLTFSIRDRDGYYWELVISAADGLVSANVTKYFDLETTMSYVANISLYEEE